MASTRRPSLRCRATWSSASHFCIGSARPGRGSGPDRRAAAACASRFQLGLALRHLRLPRPHRDRASGRKSRSKGVHFHVLWLIPAFVVLPCFYALSALGWDFTLRFLGYRIGVGRAQVAWGQPLLARYVPGSVLYVLGRVLLSERAGVPRRITIASIVYEQAISATSAIIVAAYFIINHPDLQGQPLRWAVLLLIPVAIVLLHPRVFGPLANRVLRSLRPRAAARGDLAARGARPARLLLAQLGGGCGRHLLRRPFGQLDLRSTTSSSSALPRRSVTSRRWSPSSLPAGLGVRDAAFAWAVKAAVPGESFAVGSLIAIAVRGVLTVVEVLYVGVVTALGRREGWSIPTGVLHPSPEEQAAGPEAGAHSPEIL